MAHENVLEHVSGYRVDAVPPAGRVNHVNHARLLLISFGAFAIHVVQGERYFRAQRNRLDHAGIAWAISDSSAAAALSLRTQEANPHSSDPTFIA